jgi:hypothetical protein
MSVLDYLLPKSFMSDVQTTFRPKQYEFTASEFTPYMSDAGLFEDYKDFVKQGFQPTEEMADILTGDRFYFAPGVGYTDRETGERYSQDELESFLKNMFNPESGMFISKDIAGPNIFGGQSLAEGFERAGVSDFDSAMAKPMELSSLRALDPGSYAKETSIKRGTLADSLARQRAKASQIGGGFAGYGGRNVAEDLAEQQFVEGSQAIMEDVNKQRANALQQLYSELEDYDSIIGTMNTGG